MATDGTLYFSQSGHYPAQQFRVYNALETGIYRPGVINAAGSELWVTGTAGFTLSVSPGRAWLPVSDPAQGHVEDLYLADMSAGASVTLDAPDAALARVDTIVLRAEDSVDAAGAHRCFVAVLKGVPAANPVPPRPGALEVALAEVTVSSSSSTPQIDNGGRLHWGQVSRTGPLARQQTTNMLNTTAATASRGHYEDELLYDTTGHFFRRWSSGTSAWAPVAAGAQILSRDEERQVHLTPSAVVIFSRYRIPAASFDRTGHLVFHWSGWHAQEHAATYALYARMESGAPRQFLTATWYGNDAGVTLAMGAVLTIPAGKAPLIEAELQNSNWGTTSDFAIDSHSNWLLLPGLAEQISAIDA
ncbi:hypothetical protein [Kutzneria chonburiensis]|uniref:Uncharacterized protein n=1 Tax=Kutzneria chonburiensis TaxID=1483604 RepID=A0ABV6N392_9PSEU|nr:hypothetical protein [Kutzneria chonburiensis]